MRKRMERREERNSVRFLTFSCQRRLPLLTDPVTAADFTAALATAHRVRRFELFAWVVMPEHVHLLLRPDQDDTAAAILKSVKLTVAQLAIARWKRSGDPLLRQVDSATGPRFWQKGGGFDRNVRSMTEFTREVGYIHANPVRRGLVTRATEWPAPLSSVHAWLARHRASWRVLATSLRRSPNAPTDDRPAHGRRHLIGPINRHQPPPPGSVASPSPAFPFPASFPSWHRTADTGARPPEKRSAGAWHCPGSRLLVPLAGGER